MPVCCHHRALSGMSPTDRNPLAGENHLSFIETSALDASNVELAFQNILTGASTILTGTATAHMLTGCYLQRSTESCPAKLSTAPKGARPRWPAPASRSIHRRRTRPRRMASAARKVWFLSLRVTTMMHLPTVMKGLHIWVCFKLPGVSHGPRKCLLCLPRNERHDVGGAQGRGERRGVNDVEFRSSHRFI